MTRRKDVYLLISDRLYELAFQFRKTRLWEQLQDDQLFAIQLSGNRTGYVSIMGLHQEHIAIALYIGWQGLQSYHMLSDDALNTPGETAYLPILQNMSSLQLVFMSRKDLPEEIREEIRAYAKRNNIRLAGKQAFPTFGKNDPGCASTSLLTEQDAEDLAAAIEAAIDAARGPLISGYDPQHFEPVNQESKEIVMLKKESDHYDAVMVPLPQIEPYIIPEGRDYDELTASKVSRLPKRGTWRMRLVSLMTPMLWETEDRAEDMEKSGDTPLFMTLLVAADSKTQLQIPVAPVPFYETRTADVLNSLMDTIQQINQRPAKIEVTDPYTEALLRQWCKAVDISLIVRKSIPHFEDEIQEILQDFYLEMNAPEESLSFIEAFLDDLLELGPEDLDLIPEEMSQMLFTMDSEHRNGELPLPEPLAKKIRKMVNTLKKADQSDKRESDVFELLDQIMAREFPEKSSPKKNTTSRKKKTRRSSRKPGTCVLSVSLGTGCYRHIQVPDTILLSDLAEVILQAFDFDNDHLHAFFMDNREWSPGDSYFLDDPGRSTKRFGLYDTGLEKGKKFKFLFDYGDEWIFQCKVLRLTDDITESPQVIRSKGEAPPQYPDWDEYYDEEMDEDWDEEMDEDWEPF